ncbi:hypothetical protein KM043_008593 [Ampulex compressa]|nr:hypothetical protein KM043_008593 [Ampulex compressa]
MSTVDSIPLLDIDTEGPRVFLHLENIREEDKRADGEGGPLDRGVAQSLKFRPTSSALEPGKPGPAFVYIESGRIFKNVTPHSRRSHVTSSRPTTIPTWRKVYQKVNVEEEKVGDNGEAERRSGDDESAGRGAEVGRGCVCLMELETELTVPARGP